MKRRYFYCNLFEYKVNYPYLYLKKKLFHFFEFSLLLTLFNMKF